MSSNELDVKIENGNKKLESEDFKEAVKFFNEALEIDSNSAAANYGKAMALSELEEYEEAVKSFNEV